LRAHVQHAVRTFSGTSFLLGEWRTAIGLRRADRRDAGNLTRGKQNASSDEIQGAADFKPRESYSMKLDQAANVTVGRD